MLKITRAGIVTFEKCFSMVITHYFDTQERVTYHPLHFKKVLKAVLFKWDIPASFSFIIVFSNKHYNFTTNICQSSIWCWESNLRPSGHESPPITTRPLQKFLVLWLQKETPNQEVVSLNHCIEKRTKINKKWSDLAFRINRRNNIFVPKKCCNSDHARSQTSNHQVT